VAKLAIDKFWLFMINLGKFPGAWAVAQAAIAAVMRPRPGFLMAGRALILEDMAGVAAVRPVARNRLRREQKAFSYRILGSCGDPIEIGGCGRFNSQTDGQKR